MNNLLKNIIDYNLYKNIFLFCILFLIIIIINSDILKYIFRKNISKKEENIFIFGYIFFIIVFFIIYPFIKIKLIILSKKKNLNKNILYDLLQSFELDEKTKKILKKINEIIPILFIIIFIILSIYRKNINSISYFLIAISIIFIIKCILNYSTILPDISEECRIHLLNGGCNDLLCSGHFSIVLLIYLLIVKFKMIKNTYSNYLLIITILYSIIPVLSKNHYTIDILVSLILVLLINKYIPNK